MQQQDGRTGIPCDSSFCLSPRDPSCSPERLRSTAGKELLIRRTGETLPAGTDRETMQNALDFTGNSCFPLDPVYPFNNPAGCYANGQILAHGDRWREDDCTFCQCINGEPHCVATVCGQSCMNPVKVPGECCPVCEGKSGRFSRVPGVGLVLDELLPVCSCLFFISSGITSASCCYRQQINLSFGRNVARLQ